MKQLAQWFIEQTTKTKITIIVLIFATLLTLITIISTSQNNLPTETLTEPETPSSIVPEEEEEEEIESITPDNNDNVILPDMFDEGVYPDNEVQGDTFPYDETIYFNALNIVEKASMEQCKIIEAETNEQKINRMKPYMPEVETFVNEGYFENWFAILERECLPLSTNYLNYDKTLDTLTLTTINIALIIDTSEKDKPKEERFIVRERIIYQYTLQHNNGNWTVKGIGEEK
jgi:hypothetical protein